MPTSRDPYERWDFWTAKDNGTLYTNEGDTEVSKESKQMGAAISRLIGVAQQVKQQGQMAQQPRMEPVAHGYQTMDTNQHWRNIAIKQADTIKTQTNLIKVQQEDINKLQGRRTLANYSIDDIEKELMRRLNQHK